MALGVRDADAYICTHTHTHTHTWVSELVCVFVCLYVLPHLLVCVCVVCWVKTAFTPGGRTS